MLQTTIDFRTALVLLVGVVKEFGADHRPGSESGGCSYFVRTEERDSFGDYIGSHVDPLDLKTVCLVGKVFDRLGIARALVTDNGTDQHGACSLGEPMWDNAEAMGVTFDRDAKRFLRHAQAEQDSGTAWGEAVSNAVEAYQNERITEMKAESGLFDHYTLGPLADLPTVQPEGEPLQEWEKELLGDQDQPF